MPDLRNLGEVIWFVMAIVAVLKLKLGFHDRATVVIALGAALVLSVGNTVFGAGETSAAALWQSVIFAVVAWVAAAGGAKLVRTP